MELGFKISFFLHLLSAILIAASSFGLLIVESFLRQGKGKEALTLHRASLTFSNFAKFGGMVALLTGIYNWLEIGVIQGWLILKVMLFLWFVLSGVVVGRRYFAKREKLLNEEKVSEGEFDRLNRTIKNYAYVNVVVLILIVFFAVFKPF